MTARDALWRTPSPEDAGAHTADLFDWQAAVAAADSFAVAVMYLHDEGNDALTKAILCEHHEDYAVVDGDRVQLVSVKHRGLSRGAYTWSALADEGGLAHLYARWKGLGRDIGCRLLTNSELKSGDDASELRAICQKLQDGGSGDDCDRIVRAFSVELLRIPEKAEIPKNWRAPEGATKAQIIPDQELLDDVSNFLSALIFDTSRPQPDDIEASAPQKYVEPLLDQLGLHAGAARAAWNAVLGIFRQRMRGRGKLPLQELAGLIGHIRGETSKQRLDRTLRRRVVTAQDVILAVRSAAASPGAYATPNLKIAATRLAAKLDDGGCTETTMLGAETFAERWRRERHKHADVPGMAQQFFDAEERLRYLASKVAEEAAEEANGAKYGSKMWRKFDTVDLVGALGALPVPREPLVALGGICDLASRCQVWFGPLFDVDARQAQMRQRLGGQPGNSTQGVAA
ncbi:hypothetical protein FJK98_26075 [Micromonospora sp. HM134]|uniref:hypothetical protein n=1 Tax=Micromonospora sp. HM134 TaxID=2583243 RepID=UPI0011987909|nr:hypothetical protein [Micromonospora sp. HM134]QDY10188.1 hypothetical protein FJK98_26075 [Micromonospora sp. HM134]